MEKVEQIIDALYIKIEQLVEENTELKKRVSELVSESAYYKGLLEERKKAYSALESQAQARTVAGQLVKSSSAGQVKGKIDELVREIDRCINLLSR
jgi:cell division septum initiation protein DivIVA